MLEAVEKEVSMKLPLLVLLDINGTVLCRTDEKAAKTLPADFKRKKYFYFYRPGIKSLLQALDKHPRITLGFYTSIMAKNVVPVMTEFLQNELQPLASRFLLFDQIHSPLMREHPYYSELLRDPFDTYRDLEKVWATPDVFKGLVFDQKNTLLIDSDSLKVQLFLENSIVTQAYTLEEVSKEERVEVHEQYCSELQAFILGLADSDLSVPVYLNKNPLYRPENLIGLSAPPFEAPEATETPEHSTALTNLTDLTDLPALKEKTNAPELEEESKEAETKPSTPQKPLPSKENCDSN